MSRRHRAERREIIPDPKFGNLKVSRFMNSVMRQGKKSVAESIVYGALQTIEHKIKQNPVAVFEQALDNVMPSVEVRSRRVGGATYQVPVEVRPERRQTLAIRWIIDARTSATKKRWSTSSPASCSTHRTTGETPSRSARTLTAWQRRIAPSPIIAGEQAAW